jgi:hypothetical protein
VVSKRCLATSGSRCRSSGLLVPTATAQIPAAPTAAPAGEASMSSQRPEVTAAAERLRDDVVALRRSRA